MKGEFLDTNVLVYAFDRDAGRKREIASDLVARLKKNSLGCVSIQVLMEFFIVATRKMVMPIPSKSCRVILSNLAAWNVFSPLPADVLRAVEISETYQIHFWDAMIVRAASALRAQILWTEDLADGQVYEGVPVRNPFSALPADLSSQ